ncbi:hypothetical protein [Sporosarcina sp. G11-34]|uniref:hypothetical protein n=1 Tax=Sporosarcina sp. G11-34 TaxID=2849605 RepID=UPI0022A910E2|nr:hypothetical protein [Sporosarcina sp. G11-34]
MKPLTIYERINSRTMLVYNWIKILEVKGGKDLLTSVSMLFFLFYVLIIVFVAYLLITVLIFMKKKNRSDELLLQKIDELSQSLVELIEDKRR